jgi:DNA polymerase (family X)
MVRAVEKRRRTSEPMTNGTIAARLEHAADLLQRQGANEFRVRAYRRGAETLRAMGPPIAQVLAQTGLAGVKRLPGIGDTLAQAIRDMLTTGRFPLLERLEGASTPARLFTTVADIGPKLADRIRDELGIESLTELEAAAWDGRLARVPGMGDKRIRAVRESLAGRFQRRPQIRRGGQGERPADEPPVAELLDVDDEYRRLAERDRLVRVAPRKFNPGGQAWLPILHAERGKRRYAAMYSNTGRAHELGATHDWVVIAREDKGARGQWTVITSQMGRLKGRRVVRGREGECAEFYAAG